MGASPVFPLSLELHWCSVLQEESFPFVRGHDFPTLHRHPRGPGRPQTWRNANSKSEAQSTSWLRTLFTRLFPPLRTCTENNMHNLAQNLRTRDSRRWGEDTRSTVCLLEARLLGQTREPFTCSWSPDAFRAVTSSVASENGPRVQRYSLH